MRCFFLHLEVFLSYFAPLGALQLFCLITECSSWCSCVMQSKNKQTKAVWVHHYISYKSRRKNGEVAHLFHYIKKSKNQERTRKVKILQILSCKLGSKRRSVAEQRRQQSNNGDTGYDCCNAFTMLLNHIKHQDNGDFMVLCSGKETFSNYKYICLFIPR